MRIRPFLAVISLFVLAACGTTTVEGAVNTSPTGPIYGPTTPAATTAGTATPADQMPVATGGFGVEPTLTFPASPPPPHVQQQILVQGTGAVVAKGEYLVVNYIGQVWGSTTQFDNSFKRGTPLVFQIGVKAGISGWDTGLVGQKVGTRILLTLSPSDGYGSGGKAPDILGTDTMVFVIDIMNSLGVNSFGQADAAVQAPPADAPLVAGAPGVKPTVTVPAGTPEPTAVKLDVLALGTGAPLVEGDVYLQYVVYDWTGAAQGATWENGGPQKVALSAEKLPTLAALIGVPVGSRVMLRVPAAESAPAAVFVMDVLFQ